LVLFVDGVFGQKQAETHPDIMRTFSFRVAALGALLLLPWCARGAEPKAKKSPAPAAAVPDACSFFPKSELEQLIGWELREGQRKDVSPGMSQCDFTMPPMAYQKRRFENPPLPGAAGFSSVVITTFPTTPQRFMESHRTMGGANSNVPGIGDAAFMSGPAMIFVRVGNRGLSLRLHVNEPSTPAGVGRLREVMHSLGRAGASKL
jgi:hypothetical protein